MMKSSSWPEAGDYVVCNVTNVTDFGAYVELEEYKNREGFIHISEIKAGWVKYVRDYIREGQKVVCKVNDHQKRAKVQLWKNEQKAERWLEIASENAGFDPQNIEELFFFLADSFGSTYAAFEEAAVAGASVFDDMDIDPKMKESIVSVARENIKDSFVEIAGYVDISSSAPDGVEIIRQALRDAYDSVTDENVRVEIHYVGAPRYRIKVVAPDYKKAEAVLKKTATVAIDAITSSGGTGTFNRHIEPTKA